MHRRAAEARSGAHASRRWGGGWGRWLKSDQKTVVIVFDQHVRLCTGVTLCIQRAGFVIITLISKIRGLQKKR